MQVIVRLKPAERDLLWIWGPYEMPSRAKAVSRSLQIRILILSCAIAMGTALVIGWLNYARTVELTLDTAVGALASETRLFSQKTGTVYGEVANDAYVLSRMPPIDGLIRSTRNGGVDPMDGSTTQMWRSRLETIFGSMLEAKPFYAEMSFVELADNGRELVRVVRTPGGLHVIDGGNLKQIGSAPYLQSALNFAIPSVYFAETTEQQAADDGEVLNIPVMRAMVPVHDDRGDRFGYLIVSVNYAEMLARALHDIAPMRDTLIVNNDGDYLEREARSVVTHFHLHGQKDAGRPPLVSQILASQAGEGLVRENGRMAYFVRRNMQSHRQGAFIAAAYSVPESIFLAPALKTRRDTLAIGLGLVVLSMLAAYFISRRYAEYLGDMTSLSRSVIDSATDGIISIDEKGIILSDNPAVERIFNYPPGELIGKKVNILMPEHYARGHDTYLSDYRDTGVRKIIGIGREVEGKRRDGSVFPLDLSVSEMTVRGRPAFTGIVRDISERKAAQEALRVSEERYDMVIRAMSAGLWEWDIATNSVFWSDKAREITGYGPDEPPPAPEEFMRVPHPEDAPDAGALFSQFLERGEGYEAEYRWVRRDGKTIWLHTTAICALDETGKPVRVVGSISDITSRKENEAERERLIKALAQSNQELDEFAYVASHDLKAPLRVIDNASSWLREDLGDQLDDESRENLDLLRGRVSRMERLLDDLLEYSRIGRKTDTQWSEKVSGHTLKEDILLLAAQRDGFDIHFDDSFADIQVNRMPLQQILSNLINNGIKHHDRESGRIDVTAKDLGAVYEIAVADDGPGVPERFREQIFKMFQTLKPRDRVEGSGIGLAIVRKHLDVIGMQISVESGHPRGSIFRFTYPKQC